jgi:hypothetical protein
LVRHDVEDFIEVLHINVDWSNIGAEVPLLINEETDEKEAS